MNDLKCIICNGQTSFFLSKQYAEPYNKLLKESRFCKCKNCGFTFSETIFNMSDPEWIKLNNEFHTLLEDSSTEKNINQPPYLQQALMLKLLNENKILNGENMLDYAGGFGTLSKILLKYFNMEIPIYDPYMKDTNANLKYIEEDKLTPVSVLVNSALFEHVRNRADLEHVNHCIKTDGVLILHTVVCENIPNKPDWFYLTPPVHAALHTNKSMNILMEQWGYESSLYCPASKCWVLFKKEPENIKTLIDNINLELQTEYLFYKKGFMDYWKGF